jgi:cephalosporin-C deacetylase
MLATTRSVGAVVLTHGAQDVCEGSALECPTMAMFDLSLDELREYRPEIDEPPDFDDFWRDTIDIARGFDLAATTTKIDNKLAVIDSYDVSFAGYGGTPVQAWLHVPARAVGRLPAVVQYHGYSRGRGYPHTSTIWAQAGWAHFSMDTRGQGWHTGGSTTTEDASADAGGIHAPGFLTAGITHRDTYYYRRVYVDALRMLEVARTHPLVDPDRLIVTGISQGGGITLAAAGLAPMAGISLRGAAPDVPFLCHFRRATEITDEHPYAELTAFVAGWRHLEETAYHTLGYFDGVHLARRASTPALFSVALMDDVCPPSTVFAAFNAYGGASGVAKDIEVYSHNGHEGGLDYQIDRQLSWFAERFTDQA